MNKNKSSCLLQEIPVLTHTITTEVNVEESTKKALKTYETFYLWGVWELLQKIEVGFLYLYHEREKVNFKIHDVRNSLTNNTIHVLPNISQSKGNQTIKFGQYITKFGI